MDTRYRRAGFLSRMSEEYVACLCCEEDMRQRFRDCLVKFESCAMASPIETALHVFDFELHESHAPFMKRLYNHVRSVTMAEAGEALRENSSLDGVSKMMDVLLNKHILEIEGAHTDAHTGETHIHFDVRPPVGDVKVTRGSAATE